MLKVEYIANQDAETALLQLVKDFSLEEKALFLAAVVRVAERLSKEATAAVIEEKAEKLSYDCWYQDRWHTERVLQRALELVQEVKK